MRRNIFIQELERSYGKLLASLFVVFAVQRIVLYVCGSHYILSFEPQFSDLVFGFIADLAWCFLILTIAQLIELILLSMKINVKNKIKLTFSISAIILLYFLDQYYLLSSSLLSNMILLFTTDQLIDLLAFEENISLIRIMWFILLIGLFFGVNHLLKRVSPKYMIRITIFSSIFGSLSIIPFYFTNWNKPDSYQINKTAYLTVSLLNFKKEQAKSAQVSFSDFNQLDPIFIGKKVLNKHDLLEKEWEPSSEFSMYFNKTTDGKPPNICIIIVESLSKSFVGDFASTTGHIMPFLDSLASESLYFPNTVSTSHRTHHVLPSILASLPHSREHTVFQEEEYPTFESISSLTKENYYSSFYCGIGLEFNQMNRFVKACKINYLSNEFNYMNQSDKNSITEFWGLPDYFLFQEFIKEKKTRENQGIYSRKSALDVILTISTHEPYNYPNKSYHSAVVSEKLKKLKPGKFTNYLNTKTAELASFNYTDVSLKTFMQQMKQQKGYENTLFIITGDHGSTLLYLNEMSRYHVPLLIYSPLLKKTKKVSTIVSHLDIAPTLINYLRSDYQLKTKKKHRFLGQEINFKKHKNRAFALKGENLISQHIIYKNYAYLEGKLFKLNKQLRPIPTTNNKLLSFLEGQGKYMSLMSYHLIENNHLQGDIEVRKKLTKHYQKIEPHVKNQEYIAIFKLRGKDLKKKDLLIDLRFVSDSLIKKQSPLNIWVKTIRKGSSIGIHEEKHYLRYVNLESKQGTITRGNAHFYVPKEQIDILKPEDELICFISNPKFVTVPFKQVIWTMQ